MSRDASGSKEQIGGTFVSGSEKKNECEILRKFISHYLFKYRQLFAHVSLDSRQKSGSEKYVGEL